MAAVVHIVTDKAAWHCLAAAGRLAAAGTAQHSTAKLAQASCLSPLQNACISNPSCMCLVVSSLMASTFGMVQAAVPWYFGTYQRGTCMRQAPEMQVYWCAGHVDEQARFVVHATIAHLYLFVFVAQP